MITCVAMNIKPMAKAFSEMSFCYLQRVRNPLQVLLTHCMQWLVGRNKFKVSNTLSCLTHFNLSLNISGCCATLMIQGTQESRNTKTLRQSMERGKTNFDAHKKSIVTLLNSECWKKSSCTKQTFCVTEPPTGKAVENFLFCNFVKKSL